MSAKLSCSFVNPKRISRAMLLRVVLTLVFLGPISAIHADNCTLEQLAGTYQSAYGKMECKAAAGQLECCYGNIRACDKKLALKLASRGSQLTGQWIEGSGQSGAARFAVTQDCSVDNGFWGNGRRATSPWSGRTPSSPAPPHRNSHCHPHRRRRHRHNPHRRHAQTTMTVQYCEQHPASVRHSQRSSIAGLCIEPG